MKTNYALRLGIESVKKSVQQISIKRWNIAIKSENNGGNSNSLIKVEIRQHALTKIFVAYPAVRRAVSVLAHGVLFGPASVHEQKQIQFRIESSLDCLNEF